MLRKSVLAPIIVGILLNLPAIAAGQTGALSGTIRNTKKVAISGIEVRVWALTKGNKNWKVSKVTKTNSGGAYSFTGLTPGSYKLDARMPKGTKGYYADRWYDVAQPTGSGYVGDHADAIAVKSGSSLKGYDITLEAGGGITANVKTTKAASGIFGRAENRTEPKNGHMDLSQGGYHPGKVYFRGLKAGSYRVYLHAPNGDYETYVAKGPYTVKSSSNLSLSTVTLKKMGTDKNEPNNKPLDTGAFINSNVFHQSPPGTYTSSGAIIAPRSKGDTDWTCFDALKNDRFVAEANATVSVDGKTLPHPWVDPYLVLYHVPSKTSPPVKVKEDDDSGTTPYGAKVDTGLLSTGGRYCAMVTTFGDTKYNGTSQGSAGRYTLTIKMGNRQPKLTVTMAGKKYEGATNPATANYVSVKDGEKVAFTATFTDPDKDTLSAILSHVDSGGATVPGTTFTDVTGKAISPAGTTFAGGSGSVNFGWEVSQTAAKKSPYELKLQVKDKEYIMEVSFVITVIGVNNPPTTPVPLAPLHKAIETKNTPTLEVKNSTDVDGDLLKYEFEVYQGSWVGKPIQVKTVAEATGGKTSLTLTTLKENSWFFWRARADDGQTSSNYSPWSSFSAFFVDTANDAPTAPLMEKPADKSTVLMQNPVLSAKNPTDPDEFGTLMIFFQIADDIGFTKNTFTSPGGVPVNTKGLSTSYKLPKWLNWGQTYYVRAYAKDSLGLQGPYSNINEFKTAANPNPDLGPPDASPPDAGVPDNGGSSNQDTGGAGGDTGGSGSADGGGTGGGDETGCNCRASGDAPAAPAGLMLLLALALFLRRRR